MNIIVNCDLRVSVLDIHKVNCLTFHELKDDTYMFVAVECGYLEEGINTVPLPANASLVYGEEYVYSCLYGYEPVNPNTTMVTNCRANGTFSLEEPPNCTGE